MKEINLERLVLKNIMGAIYKDFPIEPDSISEIRNELTELFSDMYILISEDAKIYIQKVQNSIKLHIA